jgi:hypothetical protein
MGALMGSYLCGPPFATPAHRGDAQNARISRLARRSSGVVAAGAGIASGARERPVYLIRNGLPLARHYSLAADLGTRITGHC